MFRTKLIAIGLFVFFSCSAAYAFNGFINKGFVSTSSSGNDLLLENASFFLLENSNKLAFE